MRIVDRDVALGEPFTIDGTTGAVYAGAVHVRREAPGELMARLAALRGTA